MRWRGLLVGLIVFAGVAEAKDAEVYPPAGLQPFLGLDDTSAPTRVQPGRAQTLQNVTIGLSADLRKRPGLNLIGDTLVTPSALTASSTDYCAVTGLTYAQFAGGTSRIVAICGTRGSYLTGTTWTDINLDPFTSGQNNQFVFTPALSTLVATNDTDKPYQWDGSASTVWVPVGFAGLTNAIQTARVATFFQNYLIFGNTLEAGTRYPTRIRWSNVGTTTAWTNADYNDVAAPAGQDLNCVGQLFGEVYLGFTNSLYRMSLVGGSGTFAFTKVSDEVGCVAKNSMQQVTLQTGQTGLLFLDTKKRVYFFNGVTPIEISKLIHTTLNAVNGARLQYAVSAVDGEHYYLCLTGSGATTNNTCLDFNYLLGEWSKSIYTGLSGINAMAQVIDGSTLAQVYAGTGDSFVYQWTKTDNKNDVASGGGTVSSVSRFKDQEASSLQVLYDSSAAYTVSGLVGAPIELTGGSASGLVGVVVDNTVTGIVVARDFSTTPTSTTTYQIGRINAYYTTRWDDFGEPARRKNGRELFVVADADIGSSVTVGYAVDFQSNTASPTLSLTPSAGSVWGTAIWDTDVWGGGETVFIGADNGSRIKLETSGRWWRYTFTQNNRNQSFRLHGWQALYDRGDNL